MGRRRGCGDCNDMRSTDGAPGRSCAEKRKRWDEGGAVAGKGGRGKGEEGKGGRGKGEAPWVGKHMDIAQRRTRQPRRVVFDGMHVGRVPKQVQHGLARRTYKPAKPSPHQPTHHTQPRISPQLTRQAGAQEQQL